MSKTRALIVLAPLSALLVAAGPAPYSRTDAGFGMTVETNIVAQVIDMNPEYAGVPIPGANGRRSADAYRRYLSGDVKKLLSVSGAAEVGAQGGANESITITPPSN